MGNINGLVIIARRCAPIDRAPSTPSSTDWLLSATDNFDGRCVSLSRPTPRTVLVPIIRREEGRGGSESGTRLWMQ